MEKNLAVAYDNLEIQRNNEMQRALRKRLEKMQDDESTKVDSLRRAILSAVVAENYDRARKELNRYVDTKSEFPVFQKRAERYVKHCLDLIQAVETKRHFPGLAGLSLAKQQEIHERVVGHFNELRTHLMQIEKVEREQKLNDVRSTVWFLKAICNCVGIIVLAAFFLEYAGGMLHSADIVFDALIKDAMTWASDKYHLF
jgi:hypothetical protein